ncbi:hypothetical protein EKH55_2339 [Sinorhizobium alkalisoli]|nr:hypothetical protein EKH55_2339 [Sinorhizobium alkalisoli]
MFLTASIPELPPASWISRQYHFGRCLAIEVDGLIVGACDRT